MKRSVIIISLGLVLSGYADATMYKWVDTQGKVHYGDTIPAEYANQGNAQLNDNGQVIRKVDAALTPAQIQARDDAERGRADAAYRDALNAIATSISDVAKARNAPAPVAQPFTCVTTGIITSCR